MDHCIITKCNKCDAAFENKDAKRSLRRHKEARHGGVTFPCDGCEKIFVNNENLRNHFTLKHKECKKCDHTTSDDTFICKHKQRKKNSKVLKCELCDKTFASPNALKEHRLSLHEQIKQKCEQVGSDKNQTEM